MARKLLGAHPSTVRVEAVTFVDGGWRTAPDRAAQLLGLRLRVPSRLVDPGANDVLLLGSADTTADAPRIRALAQSRRRGLRVIVPGRPFGGPVFDGEAGVLAGGVGAPVAFSGRGLPEWLIANSFFTDGNRR